MITHCPHCGKLLFEASVERHFTEKEIARFWASVEKQENGCWIFKRGGPVYGRLRIGGKTQLAHVVSWKYHNGVIPDSFVVMHDCPAGDNPRCVNPAHLKIGTQKENAQDKIRKGRGNPPIGTRNHMAKLDEKKVLYIRESLASSSETINSLAKKFGTSFQSIYHVARGQVWKSVGGSLMSRKHAHEFLTKEQVLEIRSVPVYHGITIELAKKYGVSQSHISKIINHDVWKTLTP
jgi:hypothetical protein